MKLIVMTPPSFFVEEDRILSALFDEGMETLYVNKPGSAPMFAERLLSLLPEQFYDNIYVHGHFYLRNEFSLAGINLEDEMDYIPQGVKGKVSCTCNNLDNLGNKDVRKKFTAFLLNDTFSNDKYTMSQLEKASSDGLINKKVYAMGGINSEMVRVAKELGFGGVVLRENLWDKFDIHKQSNYNDLINYFIKLKKIIE